MNENELRKKYFFVHFYTWNLEKNHSIIYIYDVLLWCCHKIKEAREQGDLSENAEYDAAKDEQRDIEARIEEIEKILKNA